MARIGVQLVQDNFKKLKEEIRSRYKEDVQYRTHLPDRDYDLHVNVATDPEMPPVRPSLSNLSVCMCVYVCICFSIYVCIYICKHLYMFLYTNIHLYILCVWIPGGSNTHS